MHSFPKFYLSLYKLHFPDVSPVPSWPKELCRAGSPKDGDASQRGTAAPLRCPWSRMNNIPQLWGGEGGSVFEKRDLLNSSVPFSQGRGKCHPGQVVGGPARSHVLHHSPFSLCSAWGIPFPVCVWRWNNTWSEWFGAEARGSFLILREILLVEGAPHPHVPQDGVASWTSGTFWIPHHKRSVIHCAF